MTDLIIPLAYRCYDSFPQQYIGVLYQSHQEPQKSTYFFLGFSLKTELLKALIFLLFSYSHLLLHNRCGPAE